ncbi:MAG: alanine racemase [Alphaproteobacteria bacterium]
MRDDNPDFGTADSLITIDIDAITGNWNMLDSRNGDATETAAVVKADGYGLGAAALVPYLANAGCRTFFVMSLAEAVTVRHALDDAGYAKTRIFTLSGCHAGQEDDFNTFRINPVINSIEQLQRLAASKHSWDAAIHVDTGMTRLGLDRAELDTLKAILDDGGHALGGISPCLLMSHLTASEDPHDDASARQLAAFTKVREMFPDVPASLGNSGGTLLGGEYRFDMTRPGIALYGLHPAGIDAEGVQMEEAAALTPAVIWQARILQHRTALAGDAVGYNGTHILERDSRIATVGVGYADGYPRSLGDRAQVEIAGHLAPVVGRVSMDSITIDVTDIDPDKVDAASHATLLGPAYGLAQMAHDAGTIGYEILTQLGQRPKRCFKGGQTGQIGA